MIGIYVIVNQNNLHKYVGSSVDVFARWLWHVNDLENNKHVNKKLQNAWNKYGSDNFIFEFIEECDKENLLSREQHYIDTVLPEYNICLVAGSRLGTKHTDELKAFWSKKRKGVIPWNKGKKVVYKADHMKKVAEAGRKTLTAYNKSKIGTKLSEETKKKISDKLKNRVMTKEHRRKLSEAAKKRFT